MAETQNQTDMPPNTETTLAQSTYERSLREKMQGSDHSHHYPSDDFDLDGAVVTDHAMMQY